MVLNDWDVLVSLLPACWLDAAVSTGALKGLRKDKSPVQLLRTLLMHVACGYSLRETVVRARRADVAALSDVALLKRLRKSKDWFHRLCVELFNERGLCMGSGEGQQFRLFDATNVSEPGRTGGLWRIHYSVRVPSLECDYFAITPTKGKGAGESFMRFPIEEGDQIIADRGYSRAPGIHYATSLGAAVCVRLAPHSVRLQDATGKPFELSPRIRELRKCGDTGHWPAILPWEEGGNLAVRICAVRKSQEAIRLAHKKIRERASRKGQTVTAETMMRAKYVMILTTFPEERFSAEEVLEWYRVRWQVELVFKRFKQIAQLGHLPKHDGESAKAWLYGKLLAALMAEKIITCGQSVSPWGYKATEFPRAKPLA